MIGRREFITLIGGGAAAVGWPPAARAQQAERVRRIGVLMALGADDPQSPVPNRPQQKGCCSASFFPPEG
jgi:hypothetical protein